MRNYLNLELNFFFLIKILPLFFGQMLFLSCFSVLDDSKSFETKLSLKKRYLKISFFKILSGPLNAWHWVQVVQLYFKSSSTEIRN